ncbi:ATP-binding protein [Anaeromicropila herbilytica]|uniref:Sensor histidine kinase NatK-like C-terminal domain-containing protein n=1 Tax=Anaeromicropila herbilytica TaxID=2785025 RepID=A0A7R7IEZ0_9FIRM|nr:ATP-binding protein [Anaeromicropila herbilytica]BCN31613.1 hypothetical protein bsdtb5_29080 [Anaeromicropila herbilytica]
MDAKEKHKERKIFILIGLVFTILVVNLPVLYSKFYHEINGTNKVEDGRTDLRDLDLSKGVYYLDGEWEFHPNQFVHSDKKKTDNDKYFLEVPDEWTNIKVHGKKLTADGYGTYKLTITNFSYNKNITIYIPDFGSAYRIYIDGKLTSKSGVVSKDNNKIFTSPKSDIYPVKLSNRTQHEVIIELATTRFSGLYMSPVIGDYHQIIQKSILKNSVRFVLFGIGLFSLMGLFTFYLLSIKRKIYTLWMPSMVLLILMRIMLTSEFYSFWQNILFFNLSYEKTNEIMYAESFLLKFLLIFLVQEQCGIQFAKKEKWGFFSLYTILFLIYLCTPSTIYNQYLSTIVPMLTFTLDIYIVFKIYLWSDRLKKYGMIIFWSSILITVGVAIDSYYINGSILMDMSLVMLLLFVLFLIIMDILYIIRALDLYDDFSISSSRLELTKKQLTIQKEHYNALSGQMHEIREIKHEINRFITIMNQLVEEENIEKLRNFLNEFTEKASFDQLPVFCEHAIANSIIGYNYMKAKEIGIQFECHCSIANQIGITDSDLCIILGNALENAVYASSQIDPSYARFIKIESKAMNGQRLIKVENTYNGELNVEEGKYKSLKESNSHGFGIYNMEKVVQSYKGHMKIEHSEKVFTLMIAIPEIDIN